MSFGNTSKDFNIKGAKFAGSLKPNKVEANKVSDKASGMKMVKQKGKFGNFGTK